MLPWWLSGKKIHLQCRRLGFNLWVRKIPWRRKWQPTPVFLPGKSHGQRNLAGYSPWGCKRVGQDWVTKQQLHYLDMVGDLKTVGEWLSFGNHCCETLSLPRQIRQKFWLLFLGKKAGMLGGCLDCMCPTLTLNSDTSVFSSGLKNNTS